jgi:acetylglutamate kinase
LKLLIKLGGTLLDEPASRLRLAREISEVAREHETVVVHGGGKQMTAFLTERGIETRFIGGLRVTTPEVIDAVLKVIAGTVNHQLVASLVEAGARAVGLSGIDDCLCEAEQLDPQLGAVGRPVKANSPLLPLLTGAGYLPVVACIAGDRRGGIYNVNADSMAAALACGFGADRLLFMTDVEGVRGAAGEKLSELTTDECRTLIQDGVASGGMQAKLNAAIGALDAGVKEIAIAPGGLEDAAARLLRGERLGTRLI